MAAPPQISSPLAPLGLMDLPPEIRVNIWKFYYTEVERPRLRYAADAGHGIETSTEIKVDLVYTCKQIYGEAWPVLLASAQLNIVYRGHSPSQLAIPPPRCLRNCVREIRFHCAGESLWCVDRPPKWPFKFHEFPRLATFRVCKPMRLSLGLLRGVKVRGEDMTPALYESLLPEEKLAMWKRAGVVSGSQLIENMAAFGRGGWLSRIVDPKNFTEPLRFEPDDDSGSDDDEWSEDVSWASFQDDYKEPTDEEKEQEIEDNLHQCRSVIAQMQTWVEAELNVLWNKGPYDDTHWDHTHMKRVDTLLAVVDTRTREITELRILDEKEIDERASWSAEAS